MPDDALTPLPSPTYTPHDAQSDWRAHAPLALGALCALGWLAALALGLAVSPTERWVFWARLALLVGPSVLIVQVGAIRQRGAGIHGGRLALAVGLAMVGVVPTLLAPAHDLTGLWLSLAVVLPPGFSTGIALGFVWGTPDNRAYRPPLGRADRNAVSRGAIGFALPPLALVLALFVFLGFLYIPGACHGIGCVVGMVGLTFLALMVGIAAAFAMVLVLLGGAIGSALRGR